MKGKTTLKTAALMALGLAAIAPGPINIKAQNGQTINSRVKEQMVKPVKTVRQIVMEDAGGLQVIGYDPGIPPKVYGQNYVRRGTHKRTNKKR